MVIRPDVSWWKLRLYDGTMLLMWVYVQYNVRQRGHSVVRGTALSRRSAKR